jgi:hypothetical protein
MRRIFFSKKRGQGAIQVALALIFLAMLACMFLTIIMEPWLRRTGL